MKDKDKRKSKRRSMHYTAVLAVGPDEFHRCRLCDISTTGARIEVEDAEKMPDRFMLLLSKNGTARRACQVMWRKPNQLGVKFAQPLADADHASLAPNLEAEPVPVKSEPTESA